MKSNRGEFVNIIKIIKLRFIISLLVLTSLIGISIYFNSALNENVPNVIEYKKVIGDGIGFEDLNKVKETYNDIIFTGYSEIPAIVKNKYDILPNEHIKSKVVLTDDNHFTLYPYRFIEGGKIDYLSVMNGNKIAVISDVLANSLYKSTKIVGSTIKLNNEEYKICGVYKEKKTFNYSLSEDGYEKIYIPYSSYTTTDKSEKLSLDVLTTKEMGQNTFKKINNYVTKTLGSKISSYNTTNYTILKKITFQYIHVFYFIVGIYIIGILLKLTIKHFKNLIGLLKEELNTNYFAKVLKENKKKILTIFIKIFLCLVSIFILFNLIKFNIVIEDKYLPTDNIFDITFYKDTIVEVRQLSNANESGFSNIYNKYLSNISIIEKFNLLLEIIVFFIIINEKLLLLICIKNKQY